MLASSRKPCAAARLRGGRNRPPYIAAGSGRRYTTGSPHQAQRRADEIIGPYAGGSTPQPSSARHACRPRFRRPFALHCRAGVHARRKSLRRPGRILAGPGAAPLSRLCRQLPFQGSLSDGSLPKASPARGGGCAARRRRRGALPLCGGSILQSRAEPCPVFRKGRCSHRPGSLRCRKAPRRAKSPALHCGRERTAVYNRQPPPGPTAGR